jgi:hypothetical protein
VIQKFLSPENLERRGIFRPQAVQQLVRDHQENRRDNSLKIWALLMVEVWQRMYIDNETEESVHGEITGVRKLLTRATGVPKKNAAEVVSIR